MFFVVNFAFVIVLHVILNANAVNHYGTCPRLIGVCPCPERFNRSISQGQNGINSSITGTGNETLLGDRCRNDNNCKITERCCRYGCCGYRKCVESVKETSDQCTRANEQYKSCGNNCTEPRCDKIKPLACPMMCMPGCYCKPGYVRRPDGECVQRKGCAN